jgi:hypothetical protein
MSLDEIVKHQRLKSLVFQALNPLVILLRLFLISQLLDIRQTIAYN